MASAEYLANQARKSRKAQKAKDAAPQVGDQKIAPWEQRVYRSTDYLSPAEKEAAKNQEANIESQNTTESINNLSYDERQKAKKDRALEKLASTAAYNEKRGVGSGSLNEMIQGIPQASQLAGTLGLSDLGRLDTESSAAAKQALASSQELAKGFSSAELAAQRSQGLEAVANTSKAAERRLASMQAAQGVKGGAAASQQMSLLQQGIQARGNIERDLLIGQFNAKLQGTQALSSVQQAQDATRREAEQFNLTQAAREKMMPLQISQGAQTADVMKEVGIAQAAATQAAGGSSGGLTVICTELGRQGIFPADLVELDARFGMCQPEKVIKGYHFLAKPIVKLMQKSKIITKIISIFALPWADHMAHIMEPSRKDSLTGSIIMDIGYPICKLVGNILIKLGK